MTVQYAFENIREINYKVHVHLMILFTTHNIRKVTLSAYSSSVLADTDMKLHRRLKLSRINFLCRKVVFLRQ